MSDAMLGVGLAVLGAGAPLTAAILRMKRRPGGSLPPGQAASCRDHETRVRGVEIGQAAQRETLAGIQELLKRLHTKLDRIERHLLS